MIADEAAPALTRNPYGDHESREGLLVAFGGGNTSGPINVSTALTAHGHRIDFEVETFLACPPIASTLTRGAESAGKGGYAGRRQEDESNLVAHSLRGEGFDASEDGTGRGTPIVPIHFQTRVSNIDLGQDVSGAIGTNSDQASGGAPCVAFAHQAGGTQTRLGYDPDSGTAPTLSSNQTPAVQMAWAVRRLMPVECERLQGFPDNFTNVPWRGKDSAPDGPRYKALGNSMACNAMRWIGQRIDIMEKLIEAGRIAS